MKSFYMVENDDPTLCKTLEGAMAICGENDGVSELQIEDVELAFISMVNTGSFGARRIVKKERKDEREKTIFD